jgi:hypothetical protein
MARPLISVISMMQNEERCIDVWYKHVRHFADEIIIGAIGARPTDKYPDIKYVDYPKETAGAKGMFWVKNELIKYATGEWIVLLDGDEIMATSRETLEAAVSNTGCVGFATNTHCSQGPITDDVAAIARYPVAFSGLCHFRIFRNIPGMHCIGAIHEEMYYLGAPLRHRLGRDVQLLEHIGMIHLGACLNRPHRHTVYGELMARSHDIPSLQTHSHGDFWAKVFERDSEYFRDGQRMFWAERGCNNFDYRLDPSTAYGTHWELLERTIKLFECKKILELGCGANSTPRLHSMGLDVRSFETDRRFVLPQSSYVASYDDVPDLDFDLVFIDNAPAERRNVDIQRFKNSICVVHDTEESIYNYHETVGKMRYCYTDPTKRPWTTVCSDKVDVNKFDLGPGFKTYVPVRWQ